MTATTEARAETKAVEPTIDDAAELMYGRKVAVLTGAGVSTDSGIPDYRGKGSPERTPMTVQQFLSTHEARQRFWAGSQLGWSEFGTVKPNGGHHAIARLEARGVVTGVITQNVDGLHRRAGSLRVVELHGSMDAVFCLSCRQKYSRHALAERIAADNPWLVRGREHVLRPDGDVEPGLVNNMVVPYCDVCGGTLKPDVVYFGETVPLARFRGAAALVRTADVLLIVGSSLAVNTGIRLLDQAVRAAKPVIIINRGPTKGDNRATLRLEEGSTEALSDLADMLEV